MGMDQARKDRLQWFLIISTLILLVIFFFAFGPPHLMRLTETPEFCASCHVMKMQYDWWKASSHKNIECIDCHLPNNNAVQHFIQKSLDGTKDLVYFFSNNIPEEIKATEHAKKTIKGNCVRCHGFTLKAVDISARDCWDCHRSFIHKMKNAKDQLKL